MRHGLRSSRLPARLRYLDNRLNLCRQQIEAAVVARHGGIDVPQAGLVNSAVRHERGSTLAELWQREVMELKDEIAARFTDPVERMKELQPVYALLATLNDKIGNSTDRRDKCFRELGLDRADDDLPPLAAMFVRQRDATPQRDSTDVPATDAPGGQP